MSNIYPEKDAVKTNTETFSCFYNVLEKLSWN